MPWLWSRVSESCEFGSGRRVKSDDAGVPPLAFVQLLDSDALRPAAVAHFRRIIAREGWSEPELVRRDQQVPIRWFREVYPDLEPDGATGLGLAFAEQAQLTSFGPLSLPLVSASSVAEVFELLGYLPVISGALSTHFHTSRSGLTVGLVGRTGDRVLDCLVVAYGGAALLRLVDKLSGELDALTLHLSWDAPTASVEGFSVLAGRLRFGRQASFIDVHAEALEVPCRFSDPVAYRLAVTELQRTLERSRLPGNAAETVRRAIASDPGHSGSQEVAAALGVSVSTLKRRLDREGTTFRGVRETMLRERAIVLLLDHSLSIGQISLALGYSDLANFSHAFKRWTGQSPSEFRQAGNRIRTE